MGGHLLSLLLDLKAEGTALLIASHDLPSMRLLCDHLLLLRIGRTLCQGPIGQLLSNPIHPHLLALWEATPRLAGSYSSTDTCAAAALT